MSSAVIDGYRFVYYPRRYDGCETFSPTVVRTTSIEILEQAFIDHAPGVVRYTTDSVDQAMDLALDLADESDLVCATGSLYLAAEAFRWSAAHGNVTVADEIAGVDP